MKNKLRNIIVTSVIGVLFFALAIFCFIKAPDDFSYSERRGLAKFPQITLDNVLSGKAMTDFETYTLDQFPLRDFFRSVKAIISRYVFIQKDNNDLYYADGAIGSLDYPLDEQSIDYAAQRINYTLSKYKTASNRVFISLIPDKNYFLADKNGYPSYDYEALRKKLLDKLDGMEYIDIFPTLTIDDYYSTDTHWRQEKLLDTANALAKGLGTSIPQKYETHTLNSEFSGVYKGQLMLPVKNDRISYLTNDIINSFEVFDHENNKEIDVYTLEKEAGPDQYEIFLNGPVSLVEINNPEINSDSKLIIFRDSFTSSIAPLLAQGYKQTILVDIRYMNPAFVGSFVNFENADILFLYSTSVINNSETLK